jgi:hypothetical protein
MVNSISKKFILLLIIFTFCFSIPTISFAAWWGTPGYEWAVRNGITGLKSRNQLLQDVELEDLYTTVLKYLKVKKVMPRSKSIHHVDDMQGIDNVAVGLFNIINSYNGRNSLTLQQYYIVENYVNKGLETLEKYRDYSLYLTREDIKNIDLYLALSKYKAATLVSDVQDRQIALSRAGYVKDAGIIEYGILPYVNKITRREFLLLMYDLLSPNLLNEESAINAFVNTEVVQGYSADYVKLELDKTLNYQEMYSFLYRFEIFDFETNSEIATEDEEE